MFVRFDGNVMLHAPAAGDTKRQRSRRFSDAVLLGAMHSALGILQSGITRSCDP